MNDEIKLIERILATSKKYITYAERCYVLDIITNLQEENERLISENETIYKSRCEKANEWIDKHTEIYTKNGISIIDWDNLSDPRKLKNILNGGDE